MADTKWSAFTQVTPVITDEAVGLQGATNVRVLYSAINTLLAAAAKTLTNTTFDTAGSGNAFSINGVAANANTGTGSVVRETSPTLVTPTLGVATATTINGVTISAAAATLSITNLKTFSVTNTLTLTSTDGASVAFGAGGTVIYSGGALGTPASGTLTNCTGLPIGTGVSGLGSGVATFLATPSSANLASAVTGETGSGALVFGTSPTLTTPTLSGIVVTDGATVTTSSAMGALAIDVTKGLNTKSIAADSTFTFSGAPATANTWFGVHIINTDTNPHILTFPSAFSQVAQAARTTCPIVASGELWMIFRYDGSGYKVFGDGPYVNKFDATAAPAVTDDVADGYGPGSLWYNATGNGLYICESNGAGAAVWTSTAGAGSGTVTATGGSLTANAVVLGAGTTDTKVVAGITTDGAAQLILGVNATSLGSVKMFGSTSGNVTIQPNAVAGSNMVLTLPAKTGTFATTVQPDCGFSFGISTVANQDYIIILKAPHGGTLTDLACKSASGTCTATWKIDGTNVTTGVNSVTSSESNVTPSAANVFTAGQTISITISSNSSCLDAQFSATYSRTLV